MQSKENLRQESNLPYVSYKQLSNVQEEGDKYLPSDVLKNINQINAASNLSLLKLYLSLATSDDALKVAELFIVLNRGIISQSGKVVQGNNGLSIHEFGDAKEELFKLLCATGDMQQGPTGFFSLLNSLQQLQKDMDKNYNNCTEGKFQKGHGLYPHHASIFQRKEELTKQAQQSFKSGEEYYVFHVFKESNFEQKEMAKLLLEFLQNQNIPTQIYNDLFALKNGISGTFTSQNDQEKKEVPILDKSKVGIISQFKDDFEKNIIPLLQGQEQQLQTALLNLIFEKCEASAKLQQQNNILDIIFNIKYQYNNKDNQSFIQYVKNNSELNTFLKGSFGILVLLIVSSECNTLSLKLLQTSFEQDNLDKPIEDFLNDQEVRKELKQISALSKVIKPKTGADTILDVLGGVFDENQDKVGKAIDIYNKNLSHNQLKENLVDLQQDKVSKKMGDLSKYIGIPLETISKEDLDLIEKILPFITQDMVDQIKIDLGIVPQSIIQEVLGPNFSKGAQEDLLVSIMGDGIFKTYFKESEIDYTQDNITGIMENLGDILPYVE